MEEEVENWPYNFPQSEDFVYADQRGSIGGQLYFRDRYVFGKKSLTCKDYTIQVLHLEKC